MVEIKVYATTECPKCVKLAEFMDDQEIRYKKCLVDVDPDAETEAIMLNIWSAPGLKIGEEIFRTKQIFTENGEIFDNVKELLLSTK